MTANTKKAPINAAGDSVAEGKSKYWAIKHGDEIVLEGTFKQCWNGLAKRYPNATMTTFAEKNIRIERVK